MGGIIFFHSLWKLGGSPPANNYPGQDVAAAWWLGMRFVRPFGVAFDVGEAFDHFGEVIIEVDVFFLQQGVEFLELALGFVD